MSIITFIKDNFSSWPIELDSSVSELNTCSAFLFSDSYPHSSTTDIISKQGLRIHPSLKRFYTIVDYPPYRFDYE